MLIDIVRDVFTRKRFHDGLAAARMHALVCGDLRREVQMLMGFSRKEREMLNLLKRIHMAPQQEWFPFRGDIERARENVSGCCKEVRSREPRLPLKQFA
jgi:hypothetical protein